MNQSFISLGVARFQGDDTQQRAMELFPVFVRESPLSYWRPGDDIPATGHRVLMCVATYSLPDLYFLDVLVSSVSAVRLTEDPFHVFDVWDCNAMEDFDSYFPGCGEIVSTPHAGLWKDGVMVKSAIAGLSYQLITDHYGFECDVSRSQDYEFLRSRNLIP